MIVNFIEKYVFLIVGIVLLCVWVATNVIGDRPRILSCAIGPRELIKSLSVNCFENK